MGWRKSSLGCNIRRGARLFVSFVPRPRKPSSPSTIGSVVGSTILGTRRLWGKPQGDSHRSLKEIAGKEAKGDGQIGQRRTSQWPKAPPLGKQPLLFPKIQVDRLTQGGVRTAASLASGRQDKACTRMAHSPCSWEYPGSFP
ncbi:hypothetical protein MPNT_250014 [Candidatus Methylacidithermus pantelleriae]|uniref:Uncharacterized protein n=1 Tax=Candidatus Methylacidithermus pantelleriae TaxID=2744239 RepID=A0A8J2BQ14_9BACT|nr:hypothetical protein MPNT_250014 [Candidatus Methylacidithermus pantelleriae]